MLFDSWQALARVLLVGVLAYAGLVALLRVSGNRTLSKLNAFDLVVTVALGSTLATTLLGKDVALAEGLVAFGLLIGLQYAVTWWSVRSPAFGDAVKSEPLLIAHRGRLLSRSMRRARVTESEVWAVLRREGIADPSEVRAMVLESDGSISVVPEGEGPTRALDDVKTPVS